MARPWDESRRAFTDAAEWFVRTAALVGDRWDRPGLGEWDVRALVGHTSRSLLTVEAYLARPADGVEVGVLDALDGGALAQADHLGHRRRVLASEVPECSEAGEHEQQQPQSSEYRDLKCGHRSPFVGWWASR